MTPEPKFARITDGVVVEIGLIAPAKTLTEKFHKRIHAVDITHLDPQPAVGDGYDGAGFSARATSATWAQFRAMARRALESCVPVILDFYVSAQPVPIAWANYWQVLRQISADETGTPGVLPVRPAE